MSPETPPEERTAQQNYQEAGNSWNLMSPLCLCFYSTQLGALPISVALSNLIHLCHHPGPHAHANLG